MKRAGLPQGLGAFLVVVAGLVFVGTLLANGERLSGELRPLVQSSGDTVKALQTQVLPEAHRALTSLDDLSTSLKGFAAKVERG